MSPNSARRCADRRQLRVVIEVDIGMHRAGVLPGAPVVALARSIAAADRVAFRRRDGMGEPRGHHRRSGGEGARGRRRDRAADVSADACRAAGLPVDIVSCGGTGTFPYCAQQPGVTEIEAGGSSSATCITARIITWISPGADPAGHSHQPADADARHLRCRQEGHEQRLPLHRSARRGADARRSVGGTRHDRPRRSRTTGRASATRWS